MRQADLTKPQGAQTTLSQVLCLSAPLPIATDQLDDSRLPPAYVAFAREYGVGVVCSAWRIYRPQSVRLVCTQIEFGGAIQDFLVVARTLQGDQISVAPDGSVWELHVADLPARLADSLRSWFDTWTSGSADPSIRTPWFVPDHTDWTRTGLHVLTGEAPTVAVCQLVERLTGAVDLTYISGRSSVQRHVWWSRCWLTMTAVDAATTRADFDLGIDLRREGPVEEVVAELARTTAELGWLVIS